MSLPNSVSNVRMSDTQSGPQWSFEYGGRSYTAGFERDINDPYTSYRRFTRTNPRIIIKNEKGDLVSFKNTVDLDFDRSRGSSRFSNFMASFDAGGRVSKIPFFDSVVGREEALANKGLDALLSDRDGPYAFMLKQIANEKYMANLDFEPLRRIEDKTSNKDILQFSQKGEEYTVDLQKDDKGKIVGFFIQKDGKDVFGAYKDADGSTKLFDKPMSEDMKLALSQMFIDNSFGIKGLEKDPLLKDVLDFKNERLNRRFKSEDVGVKMEVDKGITLYEGLDRLENNLFANTKKTGNQVVVMTIDGKDALNAAEYEPALVDGFNKSNFKSGKSGNIDNEIFAFTYGGREFELSSTEEIITKGSFGGIKISNGVDYTLKDVSGKEDIIVGKFTDKDLNDIDKFLSTKKDGIPLNLKKAMVDYNLTKVVTNPNVELNTYRRSRARAYDLKRVTDKDIFHVRSNGASVAVVSKTSKDSNKVASFLVHKLGVLKEKVKGLFNSGSGTLYYDSVKHIEGAEQLPFGNGLVHRKNVVFGKAYDLYENKEAEKLLAAKLNRDVSKTAKQFKPVGIAVGGR